jgi:hypothetical protein
MRGFLFFIAAFLFCAAFPEQQSLRRAVQVPFLPDKSDNSMQLLN